MVSEEITIVRGIPCVREHKIVRWIKYMPSLTDCNLSTNADNSICSTSKTGKNGTSASSVASVSVASISEVPRDSSDVVVVSGCISTSDRVWMSSVPSIAKEMPPSEYNALLAISR